MAMVLHNTVFLSTPKTGCTWCRKALMASGLFVKDYRLKHTRYAQGTKAYKHFKAMCFVRNPVDWFASRWRSPGHRRRLQLKFNNPFDAIKPGEDLDIDKWANRVIDKNLLNFTNMIHEFVGDIKKPMVNFVGRYENLVEDLIAGLEHCGEPVSENVKYIIRTTPPENESDPYLKAISKFSPHTVKKIIVANYDVFKEFGYSTDVSDYGRLLISGLADTRRK